MSILIKNVEMPTDHPLWIVVHSDGMVEANEVSPSRPVGWQTLRNAAVPVPPHGRLCDMDSKTFPTPHRNPSNDYMRGWNACLRSVQQQPTIIPAEEGE